MQKNIIHKCALIAAVIGLIIILVVILSGAAYPDMLFRIGAPVGLAFVFFERHIAVHQLAMGNT